MSTRAARRARWHKQCEPSRSRRLQFSNRLLVEPASFLDVVATSDLLPTR